MDGTLIARYMEKDGLRASDINGILEDDSGLLWLSSTHGLSRFDPKRKKFRNFGRKDGFTSNRFLAGSFHKSWDGDFFFGGIDGITVFNPKGFTTNPFPPKVVISKLITK